VRIPIAITSILVGGLLIALPTLFTLSGALVGRQARKVTS
jgi:hypothetical protein